MSKISKNELTDILKKNERALEKHLNICIIAINVAKQKNRDDLLFFYNVNQFCTLFNYDLNVLIRDIIFSETEWRRRLYARVLAMSVVEFFEDIGQLLGKEYRGKISLLPDNQSFIDKLNVISKNLNKLRLNHETILRDIRNSVIAHREHDTMKQIDVIGKLDFKLLHNLSIDIFNWLTSFKFFTEEVTNKVL